MVYLKTLEIKGFKSFADYTRLEFGPGITAIVGPNGSGKSNICDAIRWVLGEQSVKSLRGAKMEDVIFSGSEGRKALGMAEVILTFDNSSGILPLDFSEVTVTRRVYRSGDSEFMINKTACRLKDIQDLFCDTGLGREAFAIIGQGQVDAVLSSRPEERRALFEEAAGIVRYRNRKQEAVRKLESTEASLVRLQDIMGELENNLIPLKEEADKARCCLDLQDRLRQWEIKLAANDLTQLSEKKAEWEKLAKGLEAGLEEQELVYSKAGQELKQLKSSLEKYDKEKEAAQSYLHQLENDLARSEGQMALEREKIGGAGEQAKKIENEIILSQRKLMETEEQLNHLSQQLQGLVQDLDRQGKAVENLEKVMESHDDENRERERLAEELKSRLFDLEQNLALIKNQLLALDFQKKNWHHRQGKLQEEVSREEERSAHLRESYRQLTLILVEKEKELAQILAAKEAMAEKRARLEEARRKLQQSLEQANERRRLLASRLQVLEELALSYEGYGAVVRNLLRNSSLRASFPGIIGVVGELIKVPPPFEKALEIALGGAIQNIVTLKEEDARAAIQWLKDNRAGRATFLPLTNLRPKRLDKRLEGLLAETGVVGLAQELADIDPSYRIVLEHLLGGIIVVEDLDRGLYIARKSRFSVKLVTLAGEVLYPGGSLTGGDYKKEGPGLLGRSREMAQLRRRLAEAQSAYDSLNQQVKELEDKVNGMIGEENDLTESASRLEIELYSLRQEQVKKRQQLQEEESSNGRLTWEKEQLEEEWAHLAAEEKKLRRQLEDLEAERVQLSRQLTEKRDQMQSFQERKRSLEQDLLAAKLELTALLERKQSLDSSLGYYRQTYEDLLNQRRKLQEELSLWKERKDLAQKRLLSLQNTWEGLLAEKKQAEEKKQKLMETLARQKEQYEVLEEETHSRKKTVEETRNKLQQIFMKKARLEAEWENAVQRLQEKFGLLPEMVQEEFLDSGSRQKAEEEVRRLEEEIEALGPVNLGAVGEYDRLYQRYRFLQEQHQDLEEAKAGLFQVIREMEEIMSEKFLATFFAVQEAFQEIFSVLFGGGKSSLELTEKENILETGIEIIAQPPGKKMQNLSLLSGGERALTAIALLFAFLRVKPSPFCVLDEIESNLDESNVDRFTELLKEFSNRTQFILISHRQGTMEVADALYGVTMEQSSISRLVSVKMVGTANRAV
ncbi:MAG: chromosome segregation protein SMC [Clostridia bacterium]|nr:chromosome segregation protein SMC [Clostridia bacterium]